MRTTVSRWTCVAAVAAAFAATSLSGCYSAGGWSMPRLSSLNPMNWGKKSTAGSSLARNGGPGYPSPPSTQMQPTNPESSLAGGSGRPASYQNQAGGNQYTAQQTGGYNSNPYAAGGAVYTADQRNASAYGQPPAGAQNPYGAANTGYGASGAGGYGAGVRNDYGAGGYGQGAAGAYGQGAGAYGQGAGAYGQGAGAYGQGAGAGYPQPGAGSYGAGAAGGYGQPAYDTGNSSYGAGGSSYGAGAYGSGGGDMNSDSGDYGGGSGAYGTGGGSYGSGGYGGSPGYGATQPSKSSTSETESTQIASLNLPGELLQRSGDYAPGSIRRTQLASAAPISKSSYEADAAASPAKTAESGGTYGGGALPGFGMPSFR